MNWYVVDHDNNNRKLRGPYDSSETAGAVRREMENHGYHDTTLWVVSEPRR